MLETDEMARIAFAAIELLAKLRADVAADLLDVDTTEPHFEAALAMVEREYGGEISSLARSRFAALNHPPRGIR